jgi:hypothetical protein
MSVIINGDTGITTPAETVQGALTTTGNTILGDATTDTLNVGAGGLVKDASGNVGIGLSNPTAKLDVLTSIALSGVGYLNVASDIGSGGGWFSGYNINYVSSNLKNIYLGPVSGVMYTASGVNFYTNTSAAAGTTANLAAAITAAGLLQFNSGYGSVATAYGCRAWVNFNGTGTVAIRASGNVSSITDNGTGDYTVNFTTAMPDANYASVCNSSRTDTPNGSGNNHTSGTAPATGSIRVIATIPTTATANDQAYFMVAIFR